VKVKGFLNFF